MTRARDSLVDLSATPYYHCIGRCVRRAFLCGEDAVSGKSFEHRKAWVIERLTQLSDIFTIDVCAYAVMSNHYHLVLQVNAERMESLSDEEVSQRWYTLFGGIRGVANANSVEQSSASGLTQKQRHQFAEKINLWRERLCDISWYMRCLNEWIARRANREDNCKGRFWEGRFKSQALLDEQALLTCMAYVDLNPIRANLAKTPETSDYTSIKQRIEARQSTQSTASKKAQAKKKSKSKNKRNVADQALIPQVPLLAFADEVSGTSINKEVPCNAKTHKIKINTKAHGKAANQANENKYNTAEINSTFATLPLDRDDYLSLVDWTGRQIRDDKKGTIADHIKPLLERLQVNEKEWIQTVKHFGRKFYRVAGSASTLRKAAIRAGCSWFKGVRTAQAAFKESKAA